MRKLIVFCDGTWNTPDQEDNGVAAPTNIAKMHGGILSADANGVEQISEYFPGVGTSGGLLNRALGGAIGAGINDDIKTVYYWLADTYQPGDQLWFFGFSRGAFTARSTVGLLKTCGLVEFSTMEDDETKKWELVDKAFEAYRTRNDRSPTPAPLQKRDIEEVAFLGVFDTVGALGVPRDLAFRRLTRPERFEFHDTTLWDGVKVARHALAMDERRVDFVPTLWNNEKSHPNIKQIWFPGVHGDVGGSYSDTSLGDITLNWMIDQVIPSGESKGLAFKEEFKKEIAPDGKGVLHNSVSGIFENRRTRPRNVPNVKTSDRVHSSAKTRMASPPIKQPRYWSTTELIKPGNKHRTKVQALARWNRIGLYLERNVPYRFDAKGQWMDANIVCNPDGPVRRFDIRRLGPALLAPLSWRQSFARWRTGNEGEVRLGSKRESSMQLFTLVGTIANGDGVDENERLLPHETFEIGSAKEYRPKESGYLYCYANDFWAFYFNNSRSVTLTVERLA